MPQDLARIRAFVQVFDAGGFSAAARTHGRSKALLSKYVTELEDHLGVRLMNRTTRKLGLTEEGEAYYREASQILQQLDDLDASITEQSASPRGLIRISAPRNFGERSLAPAIFAFLAENPLVSIDLRLEDRFVDLVEEGIDVALRITTLSDSSLIARKIAQAGRALVVAPSLLERVGTPKRPEDLRGLPMILDSNMAHIGQWRFVDHGQPLSVSVTAGRVRVNSPVAAVDAAAAGLGFAFVPRMLAEVHVAEGRLVSVLDSFAVEHTSLFAVYPHKKHLAAKVRALIDHLVEWYSDPNRLTLA